MAPDYDLIVIGGGAAGLTAAEIAAALRLKVAIIEGARLGGECTWTGCMPSKTLIAAARHAHDARNAARYGLHIDSVQVDFGAVMRHVRQTIAHIGGEEDADTLRAKSIDVYEAWAHFEDAHTLRLSTGEMLRGRFILLATGARTRVPDFLAAVPHLTHETLFDLTESPRHLLIIGGGPVGVEMAQAMCRLDVPVTLISDEDRLLSRAEPDASSLLAEVLRADGVTLHLGQAVQDVEQIADGVRLTLADGSQHDGSHVLVAVGKRPDVRGLRPEAAGLAHNDGILKVDAYMRTSQPHIYAAGDIVGRAYFTHAAGSMASTAVINALLPINLKGDKPTDPWAIFTDPEIAQAGYTVAEARRHHGRDVHVTRLPMHRVDRAMTEGHPEGWMQLVHRTNGKLLGATIIGHNAAEMMNEWAQIINRGGSVRSAALATHIYPTLGSSNAILATEQLKHQLNSGHWLGRVARWLARRRL